MHGQLQEGLKYSVKSAPPVSGAQTYPELCLAAKNEDRHQLELAKCKQYVPRSTQYTDHYPREKHVQSAGNRSGTQSLLATPHRCYICNGTDHIAKYCKAAKSESSGHSSQDIRNTVAHLSQMLKKVEGYPTDSTGDGEALQPNEDSILQLLYSDSEDSVNTIRVSDKGSFPQCYFIYPINSSTVLNVRLYDFQSTFCSTYVWMSGISWSVKLTSILLPCKNCIELWLRVTVHYIT